MLESTATKLSTAIAGIDGVKRARVARQPAEPTIEVKVKLDAADKYGIKPGDVRRAASTLLAGTVVGSLFEKQRVFDVVVWGTPETRRTITSIRGLLIDTPDGGHVRLGAVADVSVAPSPPVIKRQAVSRMIDISVALDGRDRGAVGRDIDRVLQSTPLPLEYHAEVLGAETQPMRLLIALAIAAVIGMLLLLQVFFGSWRLATLSLLTPLIAAAGGLLAARIAGDTLTLGSWFGLFAVFGVAMRNGLFLVNRYRRLEQDAGEAPSQALVLRGSAERLAPVAMSALVIGLIALTFVVLGSRPGQELAQPLAVVLLGGVLSGAFSTLFVVPALYARFATAVAPLPRGPSPDAIVVDTGELMPRQPLGDTA